MSWILSMCNLMQLLGKLRQTAEIQVSILERDMRTEDRDLESGEEVVVEKLRLSNTHKDKRRKGQGQVL